VAQALSNRELLSTVIAKNLDMVFASRNELSFDSQTVSHNQNEYNLNSDLI
jgi:hypothetical protein